jgi:hypothetical protein
MIITHLINSICRSSVTVIKAGDVAGDTEGHVLEGEGKFLTGDSVAALNIHIVKVVFEVLAIIADGDIGRRSFVVRRN